MSQQVNNKPVLLQRNQGAVFTAQRAPLSGLCYPGNHHPGDQVTGNQLAKLTSAFHMKGAGRFTGHVTLFHTK